MIQTRYKTNPSRPEETRWAGMERICRAMQMFMVLALVLATSPNSLAADELSGVWQEFEKGGWHTEAKESPKASGGRFVSWFDQVTRAVYVRFELQAPMKKAVIFIRYSRVNGTPSWLDVSFGPGEAPKAMNNMLDVKLSANSTGNETKFAWVAHPVGELEAGAYTLVVRCPEAGGAGNLDVAGLREDDPESSWMPPDEVVDGQLFGSGTALSGPRPSDVYAEDSK